MYLKINNLLILYVNDLDKYEWQLKKIAKDGFWQANHCINIDVQHVVVDEKEFRSSSHGFVKDWGLSFTVLVVRDLKQISS